MSGVSEVGEGPHGDDDDEGSEVGSMDSLPLPPETPEMRVHGYVSKLPTRRGGKLPVNPYNSKVYLPHDGAASSGPGGVLTRLGYRFFVCYFAYPHLEAKSPQN